MALGPCSCTPRVPTEVFWIAFWPNKKTYKNQACRNPSKSLEKSATLDAQGFQFDHLLMPFRLPFSINFRDRLNLLNCNKYNAKTICLQRQASHCGIRNLSTNNVFVKLPSWTSFFSIYLIACFLKRSIWGPLQNPVGAKM